MITNLVTLAGGAEVESIWDAGDSEITDAARELVKSERDAISKA